MNDYNSRGHPSFALLPAFTIGVKDGINPCGIAAALIFIMYFSLIGHTKRRIFLLGMIFIVSAGAMHFALAIGAFDHILTLPVISTAIRVFYLLLAVAFLVFGILNILDWWQYKKFSDIEYFKLKLPVFLKDHKKPQAVSKKKKILAAIGYVFLTILVGSVITFMGAVYPQDEYMFIVHSFFISTGDWGFAFWSFFLYSIALLLPLVIAWLVVFWLALRVEKGPKIISYYKGISSALFFATGIGLGYFFLG